MIQRFAELERSQLWLSAIVAAELRFGASKLASVRFTGAHADPHWPAPGGSVRDAMGAPVRRSDIVDNTG